MRAKGLLDVTELQIHECVERVGGDHFRIFFEDNKGVKWWWTYESTFVDHEYDNNLLVGSRHVVETVLKLLNLAVRLKKASELTGMGELRNEFSTHMHIIKSHLQEKNERHQPIRVSRGHMGDLEAASLGCGNPELQKHFEKMKEDPGFEIVDNPKPGEFLQDFSILFMYPNVIQPLISREDIEKAIEPDYVCMACRKQIKDWNGDDPKCGFRTGIFHPENWQCATVSLIRRIADRLGGDSIPGVSMTITDSEQRYATIDTHHIPEFLASLDATPVCLWVGWYKNRGRTEGMYLMFENLPPRPPTELECLAIIAAYRNLLL